MKTGQLNLGNYRASLKLGSTKAYIFFLRLTLTHVKFLLGQMCLVCGDPHVSGSAAFELALCHLLTPISVSLPQRQGETGELRKMGIYRSFHIGIAFQQPPGKSPTFNGISVGHENCCFPD